MQSTENNSEPRYESAKTIDEVVEEAQAVVWKDATYFTANEVLALAAALAAERDRADHYLQVAAGLQQRIVDAPHSVMCDDPQTGCNCWKAGL